MGALTSNRKRGDDYYNLNHKSPCLYSFNSDRRVDTHISKKPKVSPSMSLFPDRLVLSKSTTERIYQYPEAVPQFRREVHAPCRVLKFGFAASSSWNLRRSGREVGQREVLADDVMGNYLGRYEKAKRTALDAIWYLKKDKEVIDVDADTVIDGVSEDSSIEEVEVVEDGQEGRSVVSDQRPREIDGVVVNFPELDGKVAEPNFQPSSSSVVSSLTNVSLKEDSDRKMLNSLSLGQDVWGVPIHKKLLESSERRNGKLSRLRFEIELNEKRRDTLQLLRPAKKLEEDVLKVPFLPLTKEEEAEVAHAFSNANRRKILATHENSNIEITGEILQCLKPGAWLNDEVINVYLELLKEREKREPEKFLKCHFFSTFFYKKLRSGRSGYDFKSVRRWTTQRKLGYFLLDCDKIFVPIHKEVHWCLAVINKKDQKFQYLDSLGGIDTQVMIILARYFADEVKDKSGTDIDVSSWKQEFVQDLPEQENGFDCGMFMIKYADFYSRGVGLHFNQEHMPYFRLRTAKEILRLKVE